MSQLAMLVGVAGGIPAKPYDITGMFIKAIHFFSGNILLRTQTGTGKNAPIRNSHTKFLYRPPGPNSLLGPIRPHITEASKVTRYLGHVHGLLGWRASTSHMFSMVSNIHHATARLTVPATRVPTSWRKKKKRNSKARFHKIIYEENLRKDKEI